MRRLIVLALSVALLLPIATGAVAAQNESETSEIVLEIDEDVRVTDVEWGDTVEVTLESTTPSTTRVTISDISPINSAGAHQIDQERVTLRGEERVTVEITLADPSNPQLSLATSNGAALLVNSGDSNFDPFEGVPATWGLIRLGVASAAGGGVVGFAIIGWSAVADRHDTDELVKP
ncbi:hypothetical protein C479_14223 [Halovivax asiaticus JCM 14624]|uniref:Uncharacterized protein n=1 Tax=Halovivax asiaticus JCM 14624 TaxID=1227490 RepID=M0BDG6_9EURY|nr:hypothetical protein [Halovivax asiaticus]ELZ08502.1 hypothetical protein C479_14223 [Halovivax asiaticus JCM 14624]